MPIQFLDDNSATVSQPPIVPPKNFGSTAGEPRSPQSKIKFLDEDQSATSADSLLQSAPRKTSLALLDKDTVVPPTAEDLQGLMDQGYKPTDTDLRTIYAHEWDHPVSKIAKATKEGAAGIVTPFLKAPGEISDQGSASRLLASAGEGIVNAAAGTVGFVTKPFRSIADKVQKNPAWAANLLVPGASNLLPDLSTPDSREAAYERWRLNYLATHDVGVTPLPKSTMDSWQKFAAGEDTPQAAITQPLPNTSAAIGTLASLPMFEGASELSGLNKILTVPTGNVSGKVLGATGAALRATGKVAEKIGEAPEAIAEGVSKKILGEALSKKIGKAVNVGETPVALAELAMGHHAVGGALAAAKVLQKAGPGIAEAGEFATRLAEANPASPFGRLFTVAKDTTAPEWMRALAGHWGTRMAADAIDATATGAKAAAVGGAIGGGLSAASGDSPEDIGHNIGAGGALGAMTAGAAAPALRKARILQASMRSVYDLYQQHIAEGIQPEALKKVGNDAMTWAAIGQQMFGDGTKIRFAPEGPDSPLPKSVYNQAGQYVPETKTAWINLSSNRDPAETVLHEIIHPIFDNGVANQPEIKKAIADQLTQAGKTLLQAKIQYVLRELAPSLRGMAPEAQKQAVAEKVQSRDAASQQVSGDPDHWIYSEILAESAVQSLYGQHPVLDVTNPGLKSWALDKVKGALESLGVKFTEKPSSSGAATILPDFKGVIDSQPLRKVVYSLIKAQKEYLAGISEAPEHGTKITKDMWGQHPGATLEPQANGTQANDFVIKNPDGRVIPRSPRQVKKIVKSRQVEINTLYPSAAVPAEVSDQSPGIKSRKTLGGVVERSGTELGPGFDQLQTIGAQTKALGRAIEKAIKEGGAFSGWYQQIGESPEWKSSVKKNTGAIEAQYKDFIPYAFKVDKQGNLLVQNYSLTAFQRKAAKWAAKHGPASLDLWGGDIGHFAKDVQLYLKNHADNLPGESNNLGVEKKNVINGFLVGGNRAFGEKNPLRPSLKGEDRQGIVRSYRLDRLETLEPLQTDFAQPNYGKQVQNLSPNLEDVNKLTPEEYFSTADSWKKAAMAGSGPTVQEMAEQTAKQNPDRAQWEAGLKAAQDQAKAIRDEVAKDPASMTRRQRELMGAAQKVQFYSEGIKQLDKAPDQLSPDLYEAAADFNTRVEENRNAVMREFLALPKDSEKGVSWSRVPAARIKKIWLDYGKSGVLRDEKGIEKISEQVLENIARIKAVTELVGHESYEVTDMLKDAGIVLTKPQWDRFYDSNFITDQFSDYAMRPLEVLYSQLYTAETAESKLQIIDRILNVIHQRGDIADLFIEGGVKTLNEIAEQGGYAEGKTWNDGNQGQRQLSPDVPLTDAGKKLVEQGYRFETRENEDAHIDGGEQSLKVSLYAKDGSYVGGIVARLPMNGDGTTEGNSALIDGIKIENKYQGQRLSEPLYRELATRLQQRGITETTGFVVHPAPLKIRDKLFGAPKEKEVMESAPVNGYPTTYVTHALDPKAKFSPAVPENEREQIASPASKWNKTGKVYTGVVHSDAMENALASGEIHPTARSFEDLNNLSNSAYTKIENGFSHGFLTTKGRFVSREQAVRIAKRAGQMSRPASNDLTENGKPGLDAMDIPPEKYPPGGSFSPDPKKIDKNSVDTRGKNLLNSRRMIDIAPQLSPDTRKPNEEVRANAAGYMASAKLPYVAHQDYRPIDELYSRAAADFYQAATHDPKAPAVKAAYAAFGKETVDQWKYLEAQGVDFEPWTQSGQPYKNSAEMTQDVRDKKHLWFFPTEAGFGGGDQVISDHPLLASSGIVLNGKELPLNDIFRAVHDYFGHAKEGYEFGPRGEYNAFLAHSKMYSAAALPAMAMETHGQNSWVNFGPHMRNAQGEIRQKGQPGYLPALDRPYAEQKANIFPIGLDKLSPNIDEAAEAIAKATQKEGGSTYNIVAGKPVTKAKVFGVSLYPERSEILDPNELTPERVRQFILVNADLLRDKLNNVGTWFDKASGKVYLDVTAGVSDRRHAIYLGQAANQKAIWDSENATEINTGGTGEPVKNLPAAATRFKELTARFGKGKPSREPALAE